MMNPTGNAAATRRDVLKTTGAAAIMAALGGNFAHAQGSDVIKVGVIGCGGRGSGAAGNCVRGAELAGAKVQIWSVGDVFANKASGLGGKFDVPQDRTFSGLDNYQKVIASGVDMVILATPPGFRPIHVKAAVEAGKHVFFEKPVAVDPVGIRTVIAAGELAKQKGLGIVAGTQRRHDQRYRDTIQRLHDGAIGEVVYMYVQWDGRGIWYRKRSEGMSDVEYQLNNWYHYVWLCGDQICEQHIHNLDIAAWVMGGPPVSCYAQGGRQVRDSIGQVPGQIWDHFAVLYEYPNGRHVWSTCRHWPGDGGVGEYAVGTNGTSRPSRSFTVKGERPWQAPEWRGNPYVQEHADLIKSIRDGKPLNEARQVAESTMLAIMGRMSAYTGKRVTWDFVMNKSQFDTMPKDLDLKGSLPEPKVAIPGREQLI